jgi:hypothetical protein
MLTDKRIQDFVGGVLILFCLIALTGFLRRIPIDRLEMKIILGLAIPLVEAVALTFLVGVMFQRQKLMMAVAFILLFLGCLIQEVRFIGSPSHQLYEEAFKLIW